MIRAEGVGPARERLKGVHLSTAHKIARSLPGSHSNRGTESSVRDLGRLLCAMPRATMPVQKEALKRVPTATA